MYKSSDSELQEPKERKVEQARMNNHNNAHIKGRIPDKLAYVTSTGRIAITYFTPIITLVFIFLL
jgi:hypothetical protein